MVVDSVFFAFVSSGIGRLCLSPRFSQIALWTPVMSLSSDPSASIRCHGSWRNAGDGMRMNDLLDPRASYVTVRRSLIPFGTPQ
jgi:hypothetical protein